jgi:hypothetical protein
MADCRKVYKEELNALSFSPGVCIWSDEGIWDGWTYGMHGVGEKRRKKEPTYQT